MRIYAILSIEKRPMQSILISSKDKKTGESFALQLCQKQDIDPIDQNIMQHEVDTHGEEKESIGIAAIRNLQKTLFLTPLKSKTKACIIQDANTLTIEAQNALLKILEEPPNNTLIILVAKNHTAFLPTVISRCKIIEIKTPLNDLQTKELLTLDSRLLTLLSNGLGERLKLAQDISKNKDETLLHLEQLIQLSHEKLIESVDKRKENVSDILKLLQTLNKAYAMIKKTNVSPRFTLENFFLNL